MVARRRAIAIAGTRWGGYDRMAVVCDDGSIWLSDGVVDSGWLRVTDIPPGFDPAPGHTPPRPMGADNTEDAQ